MEPSEISKMAVAVPGSLGIILAIATFAFMAWFIKDNQKQNEKREERLAGIIERDLASQKAQLDRIETASTFQRREHEEILANQKESSNQHKDISGILAGIAGMLTGHQAKVVK